MYWSVDNHQIISECKSESLAIDQITFDEEGRFLFTGSNDSLKVYSLENNAT